MASGATGPLKLVAMRIRAAFRFSYSTFLLAALGLCAATPMLNAQTPPAQNLPPIPDWALPGSPTHLWFLGS
jgi:hypothetical protein